MSLKAKLAWLLGALSTLSGILSLPEYLERVQLWLSTVAGVAIALDVHPLLYIGIAVFPVYLAINVILYLRRRVAKPPVIDKVKSLYGDKIGKITNGIHYFYLQDELPPLSKVLGCAKKQIGILAWSLEDIVTQHIDLIKCAINQDVQVTLMIISPDSDFAIRGESIFNAKGLPDRLQIVLKILCEEKTKLGNKKSNLLIKKYHTECYNSIIVIDPNTDNSWIQVTHHIAGQDPSSRPSRSAFKIENESFFIEHYKEYMNFLDEASDHTC